MSVSCNLCKEEPETAGHVRKCAYCRKDGTGNEIPKDLVDATTMEAVLARKPGLLARFTPIAATVQEPAKKAKPKRRGRR